MPVMDNQVDVLVKTTADTSGTTQTSAALGEMGSKAKQQADASASAFEGFNKQLAATSEQAVKAGKSMTTYVTLPIAGAVGASLKMAGDFQQSLNILQSVTGATGAQMNQLGKEAKDLGNDVSLPGISAKDAAGAMTELAKAGLSVNDVMSASKGVLSLAKAGQIEVGDAAMTTARALNAFELSGDQAGRIADLLAAGANSSTASVKDMAYGLQMAGAESHQMGVSLQDTVTALSLFSNAGINGSDAGTSLKQMLLQLVTPSKNAAALMQELGLKFFDANGNFIGLSASAGMMQDKLKNLTMEQKNHALATIFGSDAVRVASVLTQAGAEGFDKMATSVTKAGAATDLAAAQNAGFNGALDNLKSTAETTMIDLGTRLLPVVTEQLKELASDVGKVTDWYDKLNPAQQQLIFHMVEFAAVGGPALFIFGKMGTAVSGVVSMFTALGKVSTAVRLAPLAVEAGETAVAMGGAEVAAGGLAAALTGPVGLAILAAAGATVAGVYAYKQWTKSGDEFVQHLQSGLKTYNAYSSSMNFLTSAQENQKHAQDQVNTSTAALKKTQDQYAAAQVDVANKAKAVTERQQDVDRALAQHGQNSPQYIDASNRLKSAQDDLNGAKYTELSLNLRLPGQENELANARNNLKGATEEMKATENGLNDALGKTVGAIAQFGPTAISQVGSIATLQASVSTVVGTWNNWVGGIGEQATFANNMMMNNAASAHQGGVGFQNAMTFQSAGGGLQGARAGGGPVSAGNAYLVGENPDGSPNATSEIFIPHTSGTIMNAKDSKQLMAPGPSSGMASGGSALSRNVTIQQVIIQTPAAAQEFWKSLDADSLKVSRGMTPARGAM